MKLHMLKRKVGCEYFAFCGRVFGAYDGVFTTDAESIETCRICDNANRRHFKSVHEALNA